jgi:hypothetical protein
VGQRFADEAAAVDAEMACGIRLLIGVHGVSRKLLVGGAHGRDKLVDLGGVLDALGHLDTGADINRQRVATRPYLQDAIGHVCRREPTT